MPTFIVLGDAFQPAFDTVIFRSAAVSAPRPSWRAQTRSESVVKAMARKALLSNPLAARVIPPRAAGYGPYWQTGVKISYGGMSIIDMDQIRRHPDNRYKIKFSRLIPFIW
jgi:hypothetical protein